MPGTVESLPLSKQLAYAVGQLGWSTLVNIVGVALLYLYLPPDTAGLPQLITGATFFGFLNAITLIAASGRLLDAVTDPWIAMLALVAVACMGRSQVLVHRPLVTRQRVGPVHPGVDHVDEMVLVGGFVRIQRAQKIEYMAAPVAGDALMN